MTELEELRAKNKALENELFALHRELDSPYRIRRTEMIHSVYRFKLIYSICGLVLGGLSMLIGAVLFLFGITGSTSWTANFLGAESNLTDAAPGSVLFIIGLFIVFITRFKMKIQSGTGSNYESS